MKTYRITLPDHVDAIVRRKANALEITVETYLSNFIGDQHPTCAPHVPTQPVPRPHPVITKKPGSSTKVESVVRVRDVEFRDINAMKCVIDVLTHLAKGHPDFFERCERNPRMHGRTRNYISRSIKDLYPDRPDLMDYNERLPMGWYVATNISNAVKITILKAAFETAGLVEGRDCKIQLA